MNGDQELFRKSANIYRVHQMVDHWVATLNDGHPFVFSEQILKRMHLIAMQGLLATPGEYRQGNVRISNSPHIPPNWIEVPAQVGTLIAYVANNWAERSLIHLASFVLWRLNWVHPFADGNGRTARAAAYLVLCARNGQLFPPHNTIIQQIQNDKARFYTELRQADTIYQQTGGNLDHALLPFENYISELLTVQIQSAIRARGA